MGIIRKIKELNVELPPHAIGKDYLGTTSFFEESPSNTGYQFSAWGLLSLTMGKEEGVEVGIFGLNFGIDFNDFGLKLPFVGKLTF